MSNHQPQPLRAAPGGRHEEAEHSRRRRLQTIGLVIFASGIAGALLTYWLETRNAGPSMEELLPGSTAAHARQMGIMYGPTYAMLLGYVEDLQRPGGQAVLIVLIATIAAALCLHVARLPYHDEDAAQ